MHNGEQVLYFQEQRIAKSERMLEAYKFAPSARLPLEREKERLAELQDIAMLPERHSTPYIPCIDCQEYGKYENCASCKGKGEEPDPEFHCGVEGCYQCEIWPLQ